MQSYALRSRRSFTKLFMHLNCILHSPSLLTDQNKASSAHQGVHLYMSTSVYPYAQLQAPRSCEQRANEACNLWDISGKRKLFHLTKKHTFKKDTSNSAESKVSSKPVPFCSFNESNPQNKKWLISFASQFDTTAIRRQLPVEKDLNGELKNTSHSHICACYAAVVCFII